MTSISSCVSDLSVWRTMSVWAHPTTAMSGTGLQCTSPHQKIRFTRSGSVDVGFAVGHPAHQGAPRPAHATPSILLLGRGSPHGGHPLADPHLVGR